MTLLKLFRTQLNNNEIKELLISRRLPYNWTANEIGAFIGELDCLHGNTAVNKLSEDLRTNANIDWCNDCSSTMFMDDAFSCYEGEHFVCEECANDNYTYSDYRGTYVTHDDYDDYDSEGQDDSGVYDYCHRVENDLGFKRLPHEKHCKSLVYYGIELEVERRKNCPYDIPKHIQNNVLDGFALCKSDGSLENGFEITTAPMTFGMQKHAWEYFFKDKQCMDYLKGWSTDTAGLHIHISRSALYPSEIGKILVFINHNDNNKFINEIAGRSSDQWAKKSHKKITDMRHHSEKYEAVNTSLSKTIELRIFRSNVSKHGFYRVLEFTDALVQFSKNYTGLTGMSLHYKTFLRFMSNQDTKAQYPNLSAWLIRKGYINGRPSRQVSWQGERQQDTAN